MSKPTVLYNGSCPVCRMEIEHYRRLDRDADAALAWQDIAVPGAETPSHGLYAEAMRRRLHVVDADGGVLVGVPAFARIWEHLPRYRWLAGLVGSPVVRTLAAQLYEPVAKGLYAWDRRRPRAGVTAKP
jgi:predicted DCC family thiol-disulfide oxidoreductase YuxK